MRTPHIKLSQTDRKYLEEQRSKGNGKSKFQLRVLSLLFLDEGKSFKEVASLIGKQYETISRLSRRYKIARLGCLEDNPRSGRPIGIGIETMTKITALACSEAPEGYSQWSIRLLTDKVVELNYIDQISHTKVHEILKKMNCSLIGKGNGALDA